MRRVHLCGVKNLPWRWGTLLATEGVATVAGKEKFRKNWRGVGKIFSVAHVKKNAGHPMGPALSRLSRQQGLLR